MLSGDEMSEFEIDWTKDTHTWDAAEAESVPLVVLDETEEFSNYYTRAMQPNPADRITTLKFSRGRIRRYIRLVSWLLTLHIFAMVAVIIMVAWTLNQVAHVLPHTFASTSLINLYGFSDGNKFDHTKGTYTFVVPIIQLVLLSGITFLSCCFLFFGNCRELCLRMMKLFSFAETIFAIVGSTIVLILWCEVAIGLRAVMTKSLNSNTNESVLLWNSTQVSLKCCGVDSFRDWVKDEKSIIPASCRTSRTISSNSSLEQKNKCETHSKSECAWWTGGCYNSEIRTLNFYAGLEIAWFIVACIVSIGTFFSSKLFLRWSTKLDEMDVPLNQHVFIRIGENLVSLNNRGKGETLIQLNEIHMTTKGALSASTGVTENEISMEIHNYCIFDKINISREFDRIVIGVHTGEVVRGTALITSTSRTHLERIRVVHNAGIIRVFTSV